MKTIILIVVLSLTGCGSTSYYKSDADRASDRAWDDAASAGIIANGFSRPVSCMNIGGVVTCD
jgi:hypothetical protein